MALTLLTSILRTSASTVDFDKLWKEYESARKADRPKQQTEILSKIGTAAKANHSAWNFYRYWQENISVQTSRNWKLYDSLSKSRTKEILAFDEPVLTFLEGNIPWNERSSFIISNSERLRKAHNQEFYSSHFDKKTLKCIHNDYEFALWTLNDRNNPLFRAMLSKHYSAEALSFYYKQDSLVRRFDSFDLRKNTSDEYKALYEDCCQYEQAKKAFKGADSDLLDTDTRVKYIIDELTQKELRFSAAQGILKVLVRNMSSVSFSVIKDKKEVFRQTLKNDKNSFYVWDTLICDLPYLEDGEYVIESKTPDKISQRYTKNTISIAQRHDSKGFSVFAADYKSGRPMSDVDILLYRDDEVIETVKSVKMDGFVYLPAAAQKKINLQKLFSYKIQCRGKDDKGGLRLSDKIRLTESSVEGTDSGQRCAVFLDRSICKEGDSIRFKLINYNIDDNYKASMVPDALFTVKLVDYSGKTAGTMKVRTNAMGSAAGSFVIPSGSRNGRWRIEASNGNCSQTAVFRVDDVVLPTYELVFDENDDIAFPGETITVKGTLKSYSGHNLSSAAMTYSVRGGATAIVEKLLTTDAAGRFEFSFPADTTKEYVGYQVCVNVTDLTGETQEFSTYRRSSGYFDISFNLHNPAEGQLNLGDRQLLLRTNPVNIVKDNEAIFDIYSSFGTVNLKYRLVHNGKSVRSGVCTSENPLHIDLSGLPQGIYSLETEASKGKYSCEESYRIFKLSGEDKVINEELTHLFMPLDEKVPAIVIGTTSGEMWACVALYGPGNVLLDSRLVYLDGKAGTAGSMTTVRFDKVKDLPAETRAYVLYFRDGQAYSWDHAFVRPAEDHELPLEFTRMHDAAGPAGLYTFILKSLPGAEGVASVYDKAMEAFGSNIYAKVGLPSPSAPYIQFVRNAARGGETDGMYASYNGGLKGRVMMASKSVAPMMLDASDDALIEEEAVSFGSALNEAGPELTVRSDFGTVLAFEPFVTADKDGNMSFEVRTSDKLSTFIVQMFAHDAQMDNAVISGEMVVSVPVEVSIQQPRFLYEGDRYVIKAKFSNSLAREVAGKVRIDLYDGDMTSSVIGTQMEPLVIDASMQKDCEYEIEVPAGIDTLGIKLSFIPEMTSEDGNNASDAVFVSVPVYAASQTVTEAHSAIALSGADKDAIIAQLRGMFVNGLADEAKVKEISIHNMLLEALPKEVDSTAVNAVALSGSIKVAAALNMPYDALSRKLAACRNTDGGYGWFPNMSSSAVVTAVVLERLSGIDGAAEDLSSAVKWLDRSVLRNYSEKIWWGGISLPQYLYVRSLYPQLAFDRGDADAKALKAFRKSVREYLTPGKDRGLQGQISLKTRRGLTLGRLVADEAGARLAKDWGIETATARKLEKSMQKDIASLREYAVEHPSGGAYYPNAFMPWRGLLEGELYEHTLLHRLLGDDRICIWMMVQKETQQWGTDPAYVDALLEVLSCPDEVQQTSVISLEASWHKPFSQIEAAGNGMSVAREYLRETTDKDGKVSYEEIKDGEILNVGDRILAKYNIWNEENRSFVRLTAYRPANLMPVEQLSGRMGWRPWLLRNLGCPTPQGYRNVLPEATEYWYDVYPEDKTTLTEAFYVSQKGRFQTPALIIESLYAPHWRANDKPTPLSSD